MPRIAELKEMGGALWARLDIDLASDDQPVHLLVDSEVRAIRRDTLLGAATDFELSADIHPDWSAGEVAARLHTLAAGEVTG